MAGWMDDGWMDLQGGTRNQGVARWPAVQRDETTKVIYHPVAFQCLK